MAAIAPVRCGPPAALLIAAALLVGSGPRAASSAEAGFQLEQAWVEAAPQGGTASVYITLRNQGAIALPCVVAVMPDAAEVRFGMRFCLVLEICETPPPASASSPAIPITVHSSPWTSP